MRFLAMSLRAHSTPLDLGALPKSLLFLRAYMQWFGGAGIGQFASNPVVLTLTMFGMLMGATSFGNYQRLARHSQGDRQPRDPKLYALAIIVFAGGLLLFVLEGQPLQSAFDTVSAVTTTGFWLDDPTGWSSTRKLFTTVWMAIGGSSGSTAGGFKLMRLLVLFKLLLSLEMWAGRLEVLPVLVLLYPGTSKRRRGSR